MKMPKESYPSKLFSHFAQPGLFLKDVQDIFKNSLPYSFAWLLPFLVLPHSKISLSIFLVGAIEPGDVFGDK